MHIIKQKTEDEETKAPNYFSKEKAIEEMIHRIHQVYPAMKIQKDVCWTFEKLKKAKKGLTEQVYDLMLIRKGNVTVKRTIGTFGMYEAEEQHPYLQVYLVLVLSPSEMLSEDHKRALNTHLKYCTDVILTHNAGILMRILKNDEKY